jgi:hypothetical protein
MQTGRQTGLFERKEDSVSIDMHHCRYFEKQKVRLLETGRQASLFDRQKD